jgi:hypothetical protein
VPGYGTIAIVESMGRQQSSLAQRKPLHPTPNARPSPGRCTCLPVSSGLRVPAHPAPPTKSRAACYASIAAAYTVERGGRFGQLCNGCVELGGTLRWMSHIRPGDHLAVRGAEQVEGRVLRADRDGVLVDWGARLGTVRHPWTEIGVRFVRVPRRTRGAGVG